MKIFGAGVGRTGTYSLKLALNQLQLGPCHHMEEVIQNMGAQVPLWFAAVNGQPDWKAIYTGYQSAVDWPTACFYREMHEWLEMVDRVVANTGFPTGLDRTGLMDAFVAHNEAVKSVIPPDQLLVFQVKEGWGPLCQFLQLAAPDEPFPRTNDRIEFWDMVPDIGKSHTSGE